MRVSRKDLLWIVPVLVLGAVFSALGENGLPWWAYPAIVVAVVALAGALQRRSDRRARAEMGAPGVDFASSTMVPLDLLRTVPRFAPALRNRRLSFLVGGSMLGRLRVGADGVVFAPNALTRVFVRPRELRVAWHEIERALLHEQPGLFDNGLLELHLRDGCVCAFPIARQGQLAPVLVAAPAAR